MESKWFIWLIGIVNLGCYSQLRTFADGCMESNEWVGMWRDWWYKKNGARLPTPVYKPRKTYTNIQNHK